MDITILAPVIAGGLRNVIGYVENALKDGKMSSYEWGQLGKTVVENVTLAVSAMFGLGMAPVQAAGLAVMGSYLLSAVKKVTLSKK